MSVKTRAIAIVLGLLLLIGLGAGAATVWSGRGSEIEQLKLRLDNDNQAAKEAQALANQAQADMDRARRELEQRDQFKQASELALKAATDRAKTLEDRVRRLMDEDQDVRDWGDGDVPRSVWDDTADTTASRARNPVR